MWKFNGAQLRSLRERAGYTQMELAERIRVRSSQISRYEKGEFIPRPRKIKAIARVLNIKSDELFTEVEEKQEEKKEA